MIDAYDASAARVSDFSEMSFLSRIRLRTYRKSDYSVIKELFDLSFPIHYDDNLYKCMLDGVFKERQLISVVAECVIGVMISSPFQA